MGSGRCGMWFPLDDDTSAVAGDAVILRQASRFACTAVPSHGADCVSLPASVLIKQNSNIVMIFSHKENNRFVIVYFVNKVILAIVDAMVYCLQCFSEYILSRKTSLHAIHAWDECESDGKHAIYRYRVFCRRGAWTFSMLM